MKKCIAYLIAGISTFTLSSFIFQNETNCEKIKNGNFFYFTKKTRERIDIHRFDSLQTEIGSKPGEEATHSKIVWTGDCRFEMYINAFSKTRLTGDDSIIASTPAHVEIIYIGETYYICKVNLNVFEKNFELRDTMYFKDSLQHKGP